MTSGAICLPEALCLGQTFRTWRTQQGFTQRGVGPVIPQKLNSMGVVKCTHTCTLSSSKSRQTDTGRHIILDIGTLTCCVTSYKWFSKLLNWKKDTSCTIQTLTKSTIFWPKFYSIRFKNCVVGMRFTESMAADCMLTPPSLLVADFDRAKKPADLFNRTSLPCLHTKTTKQYNHKTKWANISHRTRGQPV